MFTQVTRYASFADDTLGFIQANGRFMCHSLEDEKRLRKLDGETRISDGLYVLGIRYNSPKYAHFDDRWTWHRGMIWIQDVPNFTYVYIHPGNDDDDTDACILTGNGVHRRTDQDGHTLVGSRIAYARLYRTIRPWIETEDGDEALINIVTLG